jgi:hypothetical protein
MPRLKNETKIYPRGEIFKFEKEALSCQWPAGGDIEKK